MKDMLSLSQNMDAGSLSDQQRKFLMIRLMSVLFFMHRACISRLANHFKKYAFPLRLYTGFILCLLVSVACTNFTLGQIQQGPGDSFETLHPPSGFAFAADARPTLLSGSEMLTFSWSANLPDQLETGRIPMNTDRERATVIPLPES